MPGNRERPVLPGRGLAPWQRDLSLQLLRRDLSGDCPVAALASHCGLSRSHFARAFKVSMGVPPHRWLMNHRIRRAGDMLEWTTDTIADIALSCGFADQSHLTRAFHAAIGDSPAAWRRRRKAGLAERRRPGTASV